MTRKEAITNLNMISIAFVDPVTREQRKLINDTFEMAIKALSQEPTDAISRAEVKRIVDFYKEQYDGIYHINESIDNLPSVTQKEEIL